MCSDHGFCKYYSSDGKASWQLGAWEYHKITPHNIPHTRDLLGGKKPGGWLPLLRWERSENWTEGRVYIEFLGVGTGGIFESRAWVSYSVRQWLSPALRAVGMFCGWNLTEILGEGAWPHRCLERLTVSHSPVPFRSSTPLHPHSSIPFLSWENKP